MQLLDERGRLFGSVNVVDAAVVAAVLVAVAASGLFLLGEWNDAGARTVERN
ncbi:MAG: DUF4330 family protein, partial [Haloarculaceae archaeon]